MRFWRGGGRDDLVSRFGFLDCLAKRLEVREWVSYLRSRLPFPIIQHQWRARREATNRKYLPLLLLGAHVFAFQSNMEVTTHLDARLKRESRSMSNLPFFKSKHPNIKFSSAHFLEENTHTTHLQVSSKYASQRNTSGKSHSSSEESIRGS